MTEPIEPAYAKINLALHVRRRGADGYHDLETLFAFAQHGDQLMLRDAPGLTIEGPFAAGLSGEADNLVTRAAKAFAETFGTAERGFALNKRLPIASGIGGGSADAAAALRLLAKVEGVDPESPEMMAIAASLGADVPACLLSRTTRGTGRGDRLVPVESGELADMPLLLVNPRAPMSTAAVFKRWDGFDRGPLLEGDPLAVATFARNDLEDPAAQIDPRVADVLNYMRQQPGARLVRMSGSGATCFALFNDVEARDEASAVIYSHAPHWWQMRTRIRG